MANYYETRKEYDLSSKTLDKQKMGEDAVSAAALNFGPYGYLLAGAVQSQALISDSLQKPIDNGSMFASGVQAHVSPHRFIGSWIETGKLNRGDWLKEKQQSLFTKADSLDDSSYVGGLGTSATRGQGDEIVKLGEEAVIAKQDYSLAPQVMKMAATGASILAKEGSIDIDPTKIGLSTTTGAKNAKEQAAINDARRKQWALDSGHVNEVDLDPDKGQPFNPWWDRPSYEVPQRKY